MALFTALNFLSVRKLANTNSAATWWKVGVPLLTIVVLAVVAASTPATSPPRTASTRTAPRASSRRSRRAASSSRCSGFEQADQLAGESANPKRDIPRAVIGSIAIGAFIYILLQIVFLAALPGLVDREHVGDAPASRPSAARSRNLATLVGLGWLATILYIDAVISPGGTGLIYTTGDLARVLRAQPQRLLPDGLRAVRPPRHPVVRADRRLRRSAASASCRSRAGSRSSGSSRARACSCTPARRWRSASSGAGCPRPTARTGCPRAPCSSPLAFVVANLLILWSGWTTDWKLGVAILIGYVILVANRVFKLNPIKPVARPRARPCGCRSISSVWA